jgi:hypothetical protein
MNPPYALLLVAAAAASSQAARGRGVSEGEARNVAGQVVEAVRVRDVDAFSSLCTAPLVVDGFDMETGEGRRRCAALAVRESASRTLRFRGTDTETIRAIGRCLASDSLLTSALPDSPSSTWPAARPKATRGRSAFIQPLDLKRVPPSLQRFRDDLDTLKSGNLLVHIFATDNNGISADVAIAVGRSTGLATAILLATRFDE